MALLATSRWLPPPSDEPAPSPGDSPSVASTSHRSPAPPRESLAPFTCTCQSPGARTRTSKFQLDATGIELD
jgi:hypothetical protein